MIIDNTRQVASKMKQTAIFFPILMHFAFSQKQEMHPNSKFLSSLANNRFKNCTLVFASSQQISQKIPEVISSLADSTMLPFYNLRIPVKNSVNSSYLLRKQFGEKVQSSNRIANKKISSCKLVILTVTELLGNEKLNLIADLISPTFSPLIRRNLDWHVIVTSFDIVEKVLLSLDFLTKIKYKLAISEASNKSFIIRSVCFFCEDGRPRIVSYPSIFEQSFNYFPDYTRNLMGKTIRISCPAIFARMETHKPWNAINNAKRGVWKDLFHNYFMIKFNFTYNTFLSTGIDGEFGGGGTGLELPNGTWIGVVGDLINDKADAGVLCTQTPQRVYKISFTNSYFDLTFLTFVTTHGQRVFSPKALLWPFDIFMWICILLSTIVAFLFFGLLTRGMIFLDMLTDSNMAYSRRGVVIKENWGFELQVFFVTTSFLEQDTVIPRFSPLRCFVALWLFYVLIITTVYRSKMVSLLAYPVTEKVPTTFEELSKSNLKIGFMKHGDAAYNVMKQSKDKAYVRIVKRMDVISGSGIDCMEKILEKDYACIAYNLSATYLKARNFSDSESRQLLFAPDSTFVVFLGIALQGGSLYKEGFDIYLGWVKAFDLIYKWDHLDMLSVREVAKQWWKDTKQKEKFERVENSDFADITLRHVSGSFFALAVGLFGGTAIFVVEITLAAFKKRQRNLWNANIIKGKQLFWSLLSWFIPNE